MTTPPIPETTDAPDEPITEEPPAPQRYFETAPLAGYPGYQLRLSGLDGQPIDSGEVLRGDLVIATVHPGGDGGWFARLAAEPADVTYLADQPQEAAAHAAVMHSAFTGAPGTTSACHTPRSLRMWSRTSRGRSRSARTGASAR